MDISELDAVVRQNIKIPDSDTCKPDLTATPHKLYGPEDSSLWYTRPACYWETHIIWSSLHPAGHGSVAVVSQLTMKNDHVIKLALFAEAVRGVIYNQPCLRCDISVNWEKEEGTWVKATDFSDVFEYVDRTEHPVPGLAGAWDLANECVNKRWVFGVGKPLYRCSLVRMSDCYVVINTYNHSAGDGHTGKLVLDDLLGQYNRLLNGLDLELKPQKPMGDMEEVCKGIVADEETKVGALKKDKYHRKQHGKAVLPFDWASLAEELNFENPPKFPPRNHNTYSIGDTTNYQNLKQRCKAESLTVGNIAFAATYFAECLVDMRSKGQTIETYAGIKDNYLDVLVDLRPRLAHLPDDLAGFYVSEVEIVNTVTKHTKLWELAKAIHEQVNKRLAAEEHILFNRVKRELECGEDANMFRFPNPASNGVGDILLSNMMDYKYTTDYTWCTLDTLHYLGSYWVPIAANYALEFNTINDRMCYNVVHNTNALSTDTAKQLLDTFARILEAAGTSPINATLADFAL